MQNIDGEEKSHLTIPTYYIRAMHMVAGNRPTNVAKFDHLGTVSYNVQDQTAVFSPNTDLFTPAIE